MNENYKFSISCKVNSHDTDSAGNVRPSVMMRYIHEAANLQFESGHPTLDELRYNQHMVFILSKVSMHIYRPLHSYENIDIVTWANDSSAASFYRSGQIFVGGELSAELISVWALVDTESRRLYRSKEVSIGIATSPEMPDITQPAHIKMPEDAEFRFAGEREVYNSDTDINGHMNNTNYPDMLCNFIPGIRESMVRSFRINYLHEAKFGERFRVYIADSPEGHYMRTVKSDGTTGAEALIVTEELV